VFYSQILRINTGQTLGVLVVYLNNNNNYNNYNYNNYRGFHGFEQAKISYGGLVLGLSQFLLLPQHSQEMMLASKVVKKDLKIIVFIFIILLISHCIS